MGSRGETLHARVVICCDRQAAHNQTWLTMLPTLSPSNQTILHPKAARAPKLLQHSLRSLGVRLGFLPPSGKRHVVPAATVALDLFQPAPSPRQ